MSEISLMAFRETGDDVLPPALLLEDRGLWRETQQPKGTTLSSTAAGLRETVKHAVESGDASAVEGLVLVALSLLDDLVGPDVKQALETARLRADGEPPLLRIHLSPSNEWIPWELLHDGHDFLGLSFRIARLPILTSPPERPDDCTHAVEIVRSILGKGVAEPEEADFDTWLGTFADVLPAGVQAQLVPERDVVEWPRTAALREQADILHVTCHGKRDDDQRPYWALDPTRPPEDAQYRFNATQFNSLRAPFGARRPLVFANACAQQGFSGPEHPPLAKDLFELGALNFVGTLAPVRQALAMRFARHFYEALLGRGVDVGRALLDAKRACREDTESAGDPTYLLYCLYGPPEMRYAGNGGCPA